jgi:YHS domain-containing protein
MHQRIRFGGWKFSFLAAAVVGVACTGAAAEAAQVSWRKDFARAAQESAAAQKPILLEITASWCGYCHKMFEQTFTDREIAERVNGCFVPVAIDADHHQKLVNSIGVKGLPTTVILSPELKVMKKITGFQTASALDEVLGQVCTVAPPVIAETPPQPVPEAPRLAFGGRCLVSLRDERQLVAGDAEIAVVHEGQVVRFASAEHRRRFQEDPEKYWPAWNGLCAVSGLEEQVMREGDLRWGAIYQGRVWFFADADRRQKFLDEPARYAAAVTSVATGN